MGLIGENKPHSKQTRSVTDTGSSYLVKLLEKLYHKFPAVLLTQSQSLSSDTLNSIRFVTSIAYAFFFFFFLFYVGVFYFPFILSALNPSPSWGNSSYIAFSISYTGFCLVGWTDSDFWVSYGSGYLMVSGYTALMLGLSDGKFNYLLQFFRSFNSVSIGHGSDCMSFICFCLIR